MLTILNILFPFMLSSSSVTLKSIYVIMTLKNSFQHWPLHWISDCPLKLSVKITFRLKSLSRTPGPCTLLPSPAFTQTCLYLLVLPTSVKGVCSTSSLRHIMVPHKSYQWISVLPLKNMPWVYFSHLYCCYCPNPSHHHVPTVELSLLTD